MPEEPAARDRSRGALIVLLFLAVSAFGQDAATVALEKKDLAAALKSADALTRATAARVALVKDQAALVPALREALAAEKDPLAAREEVRAIVLAGGDEDVAFAASQLPRFPASLDTDFAEAVARTGAPRATSLYLKYVVGTRDPSPFVKLSLWGRSGAATATAARLLAAGDERAFDGVLSAAVDANLMLDTGLVFAALNVKSPEIVTDTIWYLARLFASDPAKVPESLREPATKTREGATVEEELGRELLRRMLGAKFENRPAFLEFLRSERASQVVPNSKALRGFLTLEELEALEEDREKTPRAAAGRLVGALAGEMVSEPEFRLTPVLPRGLADAILARQKCNDAWIGVARATVDRAGRVQTLDLSGLKTSRACRDALQTMLELSPARPAKITSPLASNNLLLVKAHGRQACFDETAPTNTAGGSELLPVGRRITAPKVINRVEPSFPDEVRRDQKFGSVLVIAEAVITREGCVRDIRLVRQSRWGTLNGAAVMALSQWTFEPGKLNGVPVDVIFNLTVNFKLN